MHTKQTNGGILWHYNSDLSGDVHIVFPEGGEVRINGDDILEFVAEAFVRPELVSEIEDMDWFDLLARKELTPRRAKRYGGRGKGAGK